MSIHTLADFTKGEVHRWTRSMVALYWLDEAPASYAIPLRLAELARQVGCGEGEGYVVLLYGVEHATVASYANENGIAIGLYRNFVWMVRRFSDATLLLLRFGGG